MTRERSIREFHAGGTTDHDLAVQFLGELIDELTATLEDEEAGHQETLTLWKNAKDELDVAKRLLVSSDELEDYTLVEAVNQIISDYEQRGKYQIKAEAERDALRAALGQPCPPGTEPLGRPTPGACSARRMCETLEKQLAEMAKALRPFAAAHQYADEEFMNLGECRDGLLVNPYDKRAGTMGDSRKAAAILAAYDERQKGAGK